MICDVLPHYHGSSALRPLRSSTIHPSSSSVSAQFADPADLARIGLRSVGFDCRAVSGFGCR